MRCPHCDAPNDEGEALCTACATPLTAYSGTVTGEVSARTLDRLRKARRVPGTIRYGVGYLAFTALLGPVRWAFITVGARQGLNPDSLNYMGAAVGAVGVFLVLAVAIPWALVMGYIAWGAYYQRQWAWPATMAIIVVYTPLMRLLGLAGGIGLLLLAGVSIAAGLMWVQSDTREWYGVSPIS